MEADLMPTRNDENTGSTQNELHPHDDAGRRHPFEPGPTGPAPATELRGDPGSDDAGGGAESGGAAGVITGAAIAGPVGAAIGGIAGTAAGAAGETVDEPVTPPVREPKPASGHVIEVEPGGGSSVAGEQHEDAV
jgi:hypothetical protein